eukprot:TRINITY_DN72758_c0_g1_i1.p1 TRINITY_DN72758_c0_g1~~TRINITY_DN72758_c0_g1_i1.p1  ORF type:complete len:236 (+),score=55.59 TRINITY_DN72758_c0_g1_i1:62-709(+)
MSSTSESTKDICKPSLRIVVASTAAMKVAAVKRLFEKGGPALDSSSDRGVSVEGIKAPSGVNDQPFGHEETIRGALNRLAAARLEVPGADVYVSMENGLFEVDCSGSSDREEGSGRKCFDLAWVAIQDSHGHQTLAHSAGIEMPSEAAEASKASGFKATAGGVVSESAEAAGHKVDPQDPHLHLTGGLCAREKLLLDALTAAWGQIIAAGGGFKH